MNRIAKAQKLLSALAVQALIVDNPINLYYLTGLELSLGRLVIEPEEATLFVDGRYFEAAQKRAPCSVLLTAGYDKKSPFGGWWKFQQGRVGFDEITTSYADFESLKALGGELVPLKNPIGKIREIKEPPERDALRQAAALGSEGMDYLISRLKEGVTEKEMALALEIFWLQKGGEGVAFTPHIAFGEGASQPHYTVSERKLKRGDAVLIDIGVVLRHYHSDMTRVVCFGTPPAELEKIYQIVHTAHAAGVNLCRPGVKIGDLDRAARNVIEQAGYGKCFTHSLGHGVGLEIHESPRISAVGADAERELEPGMVITIEPGIYVQGVGGVRLEDTLLITEEGYENLTRRPLSSTLPIF
ncbi:M24 family metallopeptidase [Chlamydiota bacterium]